jgi:RHS repeat-associated protein
MQLPGRSFTNGSKYRYGFNGQEKEKDVSEGNYDFGARIYDGRLGRWLSVDPFTAKYPFHSPYIYAGNTPVSIVDIAGDSLYVLFHVGGYKGKNENELFRAAALTRKVDIERSSGFDKNRDHVVVIEIKDVSEIKSKMEQTVASNSKTYGSTVEVNVWSHAGLDGPVGSKTTSGNNLDGKQMTLKGWGEINFNWSNNGENCRMGFLGCNTGTQKFSAEEIYHSSSAPPEMIYSNIEGSSFVEKVSGLTNFKNVSVMGQTSSSFPSMYTNYRQNSENNSGGFINGETDTNVYFQRTYLIGGVRKLEDWNLNEQHVANPVRTAKNGSSTVGGFQKGDKKP